MEKKKNYNLIKIFVVVIAIGLAIGLTFGFTLAFYGQSGSGTSSITMKAGLYIGNGSMTTTAQSQYVVPSQVITNSCEVKVKSASHGTLATGTNATKGLLRANITFTSATQSGTSPSITGTAFPVTVTNSNGSSTAYLVPATDGFYYLLTTNKALASSSDILYEIDTSYGENTLSFNLTVQVPKNITATDAGSQISLSVTYTVIQSEIFINSTTPLAKTIGNALTLFQTVGGYAVESY